MVLSSRMAHRLVIASAALLCATIVVSCSGEDEPDTEATADVTPEETVAPEAAAGDLWTAYWAAVVPAENEVNTDSAQFDGILNEEAAQHEIGFIQSMADAGLYRAGEPEVGDATVTVDGTTAVAEGCVDHAEWAIVSEAGSSVQPPIPPGSRPFVLDVEQADDGTWLITSARAEDGATITCTP